MPRVYRPAPAPQPPARASNARTQPEQDPFEYDEDDERPARATYKSRRPVGVSVDDEAMNSSKVLKLYLKLAETRSSTLCARYSYNDLRRFFQVAGDSDEEVHQITVRQDGPVDDPLASMLRSGLSNLPKNDIGAASDDDVELVASIAVLIEADLRQYKPMCFVAYDLSAPTTDICGSLTAASFVADVSFQTQQLTDAYNRRHKLPNFDDNWLLIDVVSSSKRGTATILLLHVYLAAMRAKKEGLVAVAVTASGKRLFENLGFESHKREIFYLHANSLSLARVHRRLQLDNAIVTQICWRKGLTEKTASSVISRC
jgi:hypothetical protein